MEVLYNTTSRDVQEASEKASATYREALSIYTEVESIRVTEVDVSSLNEESNQIKSDVCVAEFSCYFVCESFTENFVASFNENFVWNLWSVSGENDAHFCFLLIFPQKKTYQVCTKVSENVAE